MSIKRVHYDLTDLCNAGCPQCSRTNAAGCKPQSWLARGACSLADFRRYSPPDFLRQLEFAYFCGNFGDPAVVPELGDILGYCWEANPKLRLRIHTNASPRPAAWWRELALAASGHRLRVIAGIDGASHETNRRYRVGTDFTRIMDNMAAYIGAGGEAEWWMIVFRHNEHEVDVAERMAKDLGFVGFRAFPSDRFGGKPAMTYSYKGEDFTLEPPTGAYAPRSATTRTIAPQEVPKTEAVISCEAMRTSTGFIDFEGNLLPCCHIGRRLYMHEHGAFEGKDAWMGEVFDTFDMGSLNIEAVGFERARAAHDAFLEHLKPHWEEQRPHVCKVVCGKQRPVAQIA